MPAPYPGQLQHSETDDRSVLLLTDGPAYRAPHRQPTTLGGQDRFRPTPPGLVSYLSSRSSPLTVLTTCGRACSTQFCQRPFYLRQLLPPSDEVRPRTSLSAISELLSVETSSIRRSFRGNDFSPSTYSRPGGARSRESLNPARLSVSTYFNRVVRNSLRLRYPLIYNRTGGTLSDGNA